MVRMPTHRINVMPDLDVTDNEAVGRLEVLAGESRAELIYRRGGCLVLVHAEVPDEVSGRGIGGFLVRAAVDLAARDELVVVPYCPFAREWLERHPEEASRVRIQWPDPAHS